ncbi:MAG: hypothetical protein GQ574_01830 [Crocinitomix sp.]|nr:hypothetical protein [Crocinitomix sp.]
MSSTDVFYALGDACYWVFENTLEPIGEIYWVGVLMLGFFAFGYWMWRQYQFNKIAEADPNQLK